MAVQIWRPPALYAASRASGGFSGNRLHRGAASFSVNFRTRHQFSDSPAISPLSFTSNASRSHLPGLCVSEAFSDYEVCAAASLRVRTFYDFSDQMFRVQDHKRYLSEREYEAMIERIAGETKGFTRVSCINATLPLSSVINVSEDLCVSCKFLQNGEDRVVVGTLDLNQCLSLPNEIAGMKPKVVELLDPSNRLMKMGYKWLDNLDLSAAWDNMGTGAEHHRAYISNVCVAKELQQKGLGYLLVAKCKDIARDWGISDLYVHVAVDNEPAKKLYTKCGFEFESDEPASRARLLNRPRRLLLWTGIVRHR